MLNEPIKRESRASGQVSHLPPDVLARRLKLADGVGFLVRVLGTRATALFEDLTSQTDITPRQFGALLTLNQQGTLTLTELARALHLDRSTLGEMVGRLAVRGLVQRSGNGSDRRSTKVSITPAGEAALLTLVHGAAALQDALLAPIPQEHRQTFLLCLKLAAIPPSIASEPAEGGILTPSWDAPSGS